MAKNKTLYKCSECGETSLRWSGQCKSCKEWNTLEEHVENKNLSVNQAEIVNHVGYAGKSKSEGITKLSDVEASEFLRTGTGFSELDRVMGGSGAVKGSIVLIGGDPGIGKSTLLIQLINHSASVLNQKTLYVTGEESKPQIKIRAERLKLSIEDIDVLSETNVEKIIEECTEFKPKMLIIDSIQTMFLSSVASSPGSPKQVEDSARVLAAFCKENGITLFLIGHVTKDGSIAGPKKLEHIVDTVIYFEGEEDSMFRIIRAVKNRFGQINEIAVFAMTDVGLKEVKNPSAIFVTKYDIPISGSSLFVTRDGTRNMLIEVQALVSETQSDYVVRKAIGTEKDRLEIIIAVMQKKLGMKLYNQLIYTSIVGGLKVSETASDVSLFLAIVSSLFDKPIKQDLAAFGEIGLSGEIRPVSGGEERIKEAMKQGIKTFVIPKFNHPKSKKILDEIKEKNVKILSFSTLSELNDNLNQILD